MAFTHTYEFIFGDYSIEGNCEFNTDGEASFDTESAMGTITVDQQRRIVELFRAIQKVAEEFGELTKVSVDEV